MPGGNDYTCPECGSQGMDSWPYDHCWKCGFREPKDQPSPQGKVFGGSTPDADDPLSVDAERTF